MESDFLSQEFTSNILAPWIPRNILTQSSVVFCDFFFRSPSEVHMKNEQQTLLGRGAILCYMFSTAYKHGFLRSVLYVKLGVFHVPAPLSLNINVKEK